MIFNNDHDSHLMLTLISYELMNTFEFDTVIISAMLIGIFSFSEIDNNSLW